MMPSLSTVFWQGADPEGVSETLTRSFDGFFEEIVSRAPAVLAALIVFTAFLIVGLIVRRALKAALGRATMAPRFRLLIIRLAFGAILAVGAVLFLATVTETSLGRIITGFGLLSLALGFALKSPLENMLSGILTILFAPFRIGDEIEVSGYAGTVQTISIHDTIIRTFDGKKVSIPNIDIYLNAITDQTAYPLRRYDVLVGIHYDDDLLNAMKVAREVLASTGGVLPSPEPLVLVSALNAYSVDLILRFWSGPTMQNQFRVVSDVTANVKLAFDEAGITIPFPIRTLHVPEGERKGAGELQVRITDRTGNHDGRNAAVNAEESPDTGQ